MNRRLNRATVITEKPTKHWDPIGVQTEHGAADTDNVQDGPNLYRIVKYVRDNYFIASPQPCP